MKIFKTFLLRIVFIQVFIFQSSSYAEDPWDGERYQENSKLQEQWAVAYIEKLALSGDERILDIGCGDGRVSAALALAVPDGKVVGIDCSSSMLGSAQQLLAEHPELTNLSFVNMDARTLDFEEEFDLVVSFSSLHWIPDIEAVVGGIERSLCSGGRFFLYFAPDYGRERFDLAIDSVVEQPEWRPYFENFESSFYLIKPATLAMVIDESRLLLTRLEVITVDEVFEKRADFVNWIKAWLPHLISLPAQLHDMFVEEILDKYSEWHPADDNEQLHFIDYWLEVEGEKFSPTRLIGI